MRNCSAAMMTPRPIHPPIGVPPGFNAYTRRPWKLQRTVRCVLRRRYGMVDPRIEKLAKVLVHYSLQIRRNDLFRITGPSLATPLVRAVYAEALAAGANPYVRVSLEGLEELFYRKATDEQLRFVADLDREEIEQVDATLGICGRWNTRELTGVASQQLDTPREDIM